MGLNKDNDGMYKDYKKKVQWLTDDELKDLKQAIVDERKHRREDKMIS